MPVFDTVVGKATNPSTTFTNVTMATGDSLSVRAFNAPETCKLVGIQRSGATSGSIRILSPYLHDNVRGITYTSAENPSVFLLPEQTGEDMYSQDTLTVQLTGGTAESDLAILRFMYSKLANSVGRNYAWGDIAPLIEHYRPVEVDVTNSATVGVWTDTLITATEDELLANRDYALLGYITDVAQASVGVKGVETVNLRYTGPGTTATDDTSDWFIRRSMDLGVPAIPVFNSANKNGIYVSTVDVVASTTPKVQLVMALLKQNLG